ncbi:phosphatase PAP2 family protein [Pseudomonas protegens]|uniref:acid phosphatase n=1 Tax=Pseudomonas protegens TaxID=380021 RepID=UPI00223A7832|nr:phosphatase PAP2 family protein [Pseudomonas protegens]
MAEKSQALRGSKRWELAISDANLKFPAAAETFSCALNAPISEQQTPALYRVLRRTLTDAGMATYSAKTHHMRTRPFVYNQQPSCTPEDEAKLAADGSYPSGHSAIGWAWALLLSELAPEYGNALWARGRAYSESRMVCNVHWYSDIREGREIGATTVARLHADPTFQADFAVARQELLAVRAKGLSASGDCAAQAQALALGAD